MNRIERTEFVFENALARDQAADHLTTYAINRSGVDLIICDTEKAAEFAATLINEGFNGDFHVRRARP